MRNRNSLHAWHLSTNLEGGAAIAARRIHESVKTVGVDSILWHTSASKINDPTIKQIPNGLISRGLKFIGARLKSPLSVVSGRDFYGLPFMPRALPWARRNVVLPDIIHIHWSQQWLSFSVKDSKVLRHIPVIVTLHDMYPFTGGCIYSWDCEGYKKGCGNCPQLKKPYFGDSSQKAFKQKQLFFDKLTFGVVAPSKWMLDQAASSPVFRNAASFEVIPYGIELDEYKLIDRSIAKKALGITPDNLVIGFGAATGTSDPRKGFRELDAALTQIAKISNKSVTLLNFGPSYNNDKATCAYEVVSLGSLESIRLQSIAYSASDVFAAPSLEDNAPQVVIEAQLCGTPCVVFNAGGVSELIINSQAPSIVRKGDINGLAAALISTEFNLLDRGNIRDSIMRKNGQQKQGESYVSTYGNIADIAKSR